MDKFVVLTKELKKTLNVKLRREYNNTAFFYRVSKGYNTGKGSMKINLDAILGLTAHSVDSCFMELENYNIMFNDIIVGGLTVKRGISKITVYNFYIDDEHKRRGFGYNSLVELCNTELCEGTSVVDFSFSNKNNAAIGLLNKYRCNCKKDTL